MRRGATYGSWFEFIALVVLLAGVMVILSHNMNQDYGANYDISYGFYSNDTYDSLVEFQSDLDNQTKSGTKEQSSFGALVFSTAPSIISLTYDLVTSFMRGDFIKNIANNLNLGSYANIVIVIWYLLLVVSIGFILIKIATRIIT